MKHEAIAKWPVDHEEAFAVLASAASQVELHSNLEEPKLIAAIETDYGFGGEVLYAAAVVFSFPELTEMEHAFGHARVNFPYVPGLLFYREGPIIIEILAKLTTDVDVIMVGNHGIAHPRRCGMASHIGLIFDRPSIGCSRKLLAGIHRPVGELKGSSQPLILQGKEVGLALRSKDGVKPLFISPGHKCDLPYAREIVVRCLRGFRLPEPLRMAHLLANRYRRRQEKEILHRA